MCATLLGVPAGALLAIDLPAESFQKVFGLLFLAMAAVIAAKPNLLLKATRKPIRSPWAEAALFFSIGVYVGFIQAGMGILLLLGMGWFHARDLVGANGVKNAIGLIVTTAALAMFVFYGQVAWRPGIIMAAGNLAGGFVGARIAISKGQRLIFTFLIIVMVITGVRLLWK
ncbi:sulfite exporter TauE/SafE family protein [Pirellulales bacterium]|nr:sulfite exporter TauE/SafE family protein [Pirellulales bacterium]